VKKFLSAFFIFMLYALTAADISVEGPQTFYAGRESSITVKTEKESRDNISWNIRYSGAPVASGEQEISGGAAKIKFTFPETRPCVIAKAEFNCSCGDEKPKKDLFFYPPNPFSEKKKSLEELSIEVWHTEADGSVTELFKALEIPFSEISNFTESKGKVLIITGIDFSSFPGVAENLIRTASEGTKIIIINPLGTFPFKTFEPITEILLAGNGKIKEFDKNFDDENWGGKAPSLRSLRLASYDGAPALEITEDRKNFTFCSLKAGKGSIVICAWDIIGSSKASPTPLYLLDKLICPDKDK